MFKVMVQGKTREELITSLAAFMEMLGPSMVDPGIPTSPPPADEPKKGRGRPKKETTKAEETNPVTKPPQEVPAASAFDDPFAQAPEPKESKKEYTAAQVTSALMEYAKQRTGDTSPADGAKRVYDLIQQYGYKNVKEIKAEHYAAIMAGTGLA